MAAAPEMTEFPLLSFDELKRNFCHACQNKNFDHPWPSKTIIFFKVDTIDLENTKKLIGSLREKGLKLRSWRQQVNETSHAEVIIIDKYLANIESDKFRVEMVVSYSPCNACSRKLIDFKTKKKDVEIKIKIANFYNHYKGDTSELPSLIKHGFDLSVFNGEEEWVDFYKGLVETAILGHYRTEHRYRNCDTDRSRRENRKKTDRTPLVEFIAQNLHLLIKHDFELSVFSCEEECVASYKDIFATAIRDHYRTEHQYRNSDDEGATREIREKKDRDLLVELIVQNLQLLIRLDLKLSVSRGEEECVASYTGPVATAIRDHYRTEHRYRNSDDERATRENREKKIGLC